MNSLKHRSLGLLVGVVMAATCGSPVMANDTEIFVGTTTNAVKPNILFVLDTSGSMATDVVTENAPYDPAQVYAGGCSASRVYWVRDQGNAILPPGCGTNNYFNLTNFQCKTALDAFATGGQYAATRAAQWTPGNTRWEAISSNIKNQDVECRADAGIHGDGVNLTQLWARDNSAKWGSLAQQITWSANNTNRNYIFYSANYLNWYNNPASFTVSTRLKVVQDVATNVLQSITGVNVGLMRYSSNTFNSCSDSSAEGGMVTFALSDIDAGTTRTDIVNTINSYNASGCTPLSETLYEAEQYFRGGAVDYGVNSRTTPNSGGEFPSVPASRLPANQSLYKSPMEFSCQKNFIVYLTDGEPTADISADSKITSLPNFTSLVGASCNGSGNGRCLDDLAEYLFDADLAPSVNGKQNVISHFIGFGPDVTGSALLQQSAARGGGNFYSADNTVGLTSVLTSLVSQILRTNTSFTAPSVSVNAFNRTETLSDLYVSVFRPDTTYRWPGNVKKYRVTDGQIRDADNNAAVDASIGFFASNARSYWSAAVDGADVASGGAANRQPLDPALRKVYTNIDSANPDLTALTNQLSVLNLLISDAKLGTGAVGQPTRDEVIEWARGRDVGDADLDGNVLEARHDMGDPLHVKPAVVIYGGTQATPDLDDAVVYAPTNDGFLHALDTVTGDELWSFMPENLLDNVLPLYLNTAIDEKHFGLDAEIRVLKYDVNQNGIVESAAGDKVFLFFGQGRGGSNYYALDVTNKNQPRFLWMRSPAQLPGIGQTWSAPIVTRVKIGTGSGQNSQQLVLIFGGGYDDTEDNNPYHVDTVGKGIYMVDALTGTLLWWASNSGATLNLPAMTHSFPGNMAVLDLDGDVFADRIYAGDMGGRVWRFDIANGQPAASLVTGGVLANLGAAPLSAPQPLTATRRFYNAPDVALVKRRGKASFFNIALGSGFRGHPLDASTQDRFYSIRDYNPFTRFTQAQYNALVAVLDSDLVDVTSTATPTMPNGAKGWRLELRLPGGWVGEKVLAESRTFDNKVFFPTYLPNSGALACAPAAGSNRAYIVSVFDGSPVIEQDGVTGTTVDDRFTELKQGGIAPEVVFLFPARDPNSPLGADQSPLVCLSGAEVLGSCSNFTSRFKTIWRESGAN